VTDESRTGDSAGSTEQVSETPAVETKEVELSEGMRKGQQVVNMYVPKPAPADTPLEEFGLAPPPSADPAQSEPGSAAGPEEQGDSSAQ
jgi:hypothetical protein